MHGSYFVAGLLACACLAGCARDEAREPDLTTRRVEVRSEALVAPSKDDQSGGGVPEAAAFKPARATTAPAAAMPAAEAKPVVEIDRPTRDAIGAAALKHILSRYPPANDAKLNEYLVLVGSLLTLDAPKGEGEYEYLVIDSDRPISFAAAPKTLAVSRGLIARMVDEAELAGVLAREMANLRAGRAMAALGLMVAQAPTGTSNVKPEIYAGKFSEALLSQELSAEMEELADLEGARLAASAKYAPDGFLRVLARLHPDARPGSPQWERLRNLDANVSIVAKANPSADVRLPVRFQSYVKGRK